MARKPNSTRKSAGRPKRAAVVPPAPPELATRHSELASHRRPSALLDTRVIYCGDCLDQVRRLPDQCLDLIYIDFPFNSNRNYEVFWADLPEPERKRGAIRARAEATRLRAHFEHLHGSMRTVGIGHLPALDGARPEDGGHGPPYAPVQSSLGAESTVLIQIGATP